MRCSRRDPRLHQTQNFARTGEGFPRRRQESPEFSSDSLSGKNSDVVDFFVACDFLIGSGGWNHDTENLFAILYGLAQELGDARMCAIVGDLPKEQKFSVLRMLRNRGPERFPASLKRLWESFPPLGVQNPKELLPPVVLEKADRIMDGGSLCGKLRGANGKEFLFFIGASSFESDRSMDGLFVGYMSGHIPKSARARYEGWTQRDFCLLLEQAIRTQFRWNSLSDRFVPRDPTQFSDSLGIGVTARRLLRYAVSGQQRQESLMPKNGDSK
jgi:hypothetical protein